MEIKEIKGYLGAGVKFFSKGELYTLEFHEVNYLLSGIDGWKLALRPLSDLTKEIEHNGEKVNVYEILGSVYQFYIDAILKGEIPINYLPYECIEILLKYHFDIHNLIEKGEAININTLK